MILTILATTLHIIIWREPQMGQKGRGVTHCKQIVNLLADELQKYPLYLGGEHLL